AAIATASFRFSARPSRIMSSRSSCDASVLWTPLFKVVVLILNLLYWLIFGSFKLDPSYSPSPASRLPTANAWDSRTDDGRELHKGSASFTDEALPVDLELATHLANPCR